MAMIERAVTVGSGFGAALVEGIIYRFSPIAGLIITLLSAIGGTIGALYVRGKGGDVLEGVGSGSVGAFGFLLPLIIAPPSRRVETSGSGVVKIGGRVDEAALGAAQSARKLLGMGTATEVAGANAGSRATARSVVEF